MWQQWINGVIGLIVVAYALNGVGMWTLAITGVAIAILGFWGAMQHRSMTGHGHTRMATHYQS